MLGTPPTPSCVSTLSPPPRRHHLSANPPRPPTRGPHWPRGWLTCASPPTKPRPRKPSRCFFFLPLLLERRKKKIFSLFWGVSLSHSFFLPLFSRWSINLSINRCYFSTPIRRLLPSRPLLLPLIPVPFPSHPPATSELSPPRWIGPPPRSIHVGKSSSLLRPVFVYFYPAILLRDWCLDRVERVLCSDISWLVCWLRESYGLRRTWEPGTGQTCTGWGWSILGSLSGNLGLVEGGNSFGLESSNPYSTTFTSINKNRSCILRN